MKHLAFALAASLLVAGCTTPGAGRSTLAVTLTGLQVVPGPGDPDGTGTAEVRVSPGVGQLCWNLYVRQIGHATSAHIHRGAAGSAGPVVLDIPTPDAAGRSQGCTSIDNRLAREIGAHGFAFYLDVHTAELPGGAVRGQLRGEGPDRFRR